MRWFEDPNAPEFLQTSANVAGASAPGQRARGAAAAERFGAALRLVAPMLIESSAIAVLAYGCCLAWKPLGFIVPGALIFGLSVFADLRSSTVLKNPQGKES